MRLAKFGSFRESDCHALLAYACTHSTDMSVAALANELNIPKRTLDLILEDEVENKRGSKLAACAEHWHYDYKVDRDALMHGKGPDNKRVVIIDAVWRGY